MSERTCLQIPLRLRYAIVIREWRAHKGLSLAEFARQVGLHRQYLWTLEKGASYTLDTLESMLVQIRGAPYESPLRSQVGERIRQVRKGKGWSQESISERCGVSILHLSRMERGTTNATLDLLDVLVKALGTTGEFAIEGLEGDDLEVRLLAISKSFHRFQIECESGESSPLA